MTLGHITHAAQAGVHVLRYFGTVNYTLAPGLQRFLHELIQAGSVSGLVSISPQPSRWTARTWA